MSTVSTNKMAPWRSMFQQRVKFPRCGIVSDNASPVYSFKLKSEYDRIFFVCMNHDNHLVIAEPYNNRCIFVDPSNNGSIVGTIESESHFRQLAGPHGVCVNSAGLIIVANHWNDSIQIFTSDGIFVRLFGSRGAAPGKFNKPSDVCVDSDDNIIVVDHHNHRIQVFKSDGTFLHTFGAFGSGAGQFCFPNSVCVTGNGSIIVTDTGNYRIQIFSGDGTFLHAFGSSGMFQYPYGVCVDSVDNIFVTDITFNSVQQFRGDGTFVRRLCDFVDGSHLCPSSICVGLDGSLYVADSKNHRICVYK